MSRNAAKERMEARCFEVMNNYPEYCDDNTHLLACKFIFEDYGVVITPEMVSKLRSIDRSRQKVLVNHPHLDMRRRAFDLEENDREYYRT